ncbi:MAG: trimethylamine methyltransferase family protein [Candidatus Omnitrophica bacterium]|nr:trimethylamine methyltransferase family protein [Candidatus Omnitrophota bacterium]
MKLSKLTVLSEAEIKEIHEATLDILENCGVKINNSKMFSFLRERGLKADRESQIVRFSRNCIGDALSSIPAKFEVFDREGKFSFLLGDGVSKIGAGHNAVFWADSDTGKTRPSTVADVELFSRICEKLPDIDVIGIPVMPQDVPNPKASLLYGVKACIENSKKPIFFSTDRPETNLAVIKMLSAVFAGDIKRQAYGISQLSSTSPLSWEDGVLEAIMETVDNGVPLAILPEPNAGVSCPYTLAGLLTMNNAECLSGLVMAQMLKPGAKVMYANSWTTTDMRSGAALVGSAETTVCRIAGAQLAGFYRVPSHTTAPNSDNHAHDEQNSWEKTLSLFASVAAGNDLIVNCGMFATGMTFSHEQLLMDEEMAATTRRVSAGISVSRETIAQDLIKEVGPAGKTYLDEAHTLKWLRSAEYYVPGLAVRGPRASWEAAGSKDIYRLACEKVNRYKSLSGSPLGAKQKDLLAEIIKNFK